MESFAKYTKAPREETCLLVDEPAVLFLNRTFFELTAALGGFVVCAAAFDQAFGGLALGFGIGYLVPQYRMRFCRGWLEHLFWSLGLYNPDKLARYRLFSLKRPVVVMGPGQRNK